MRRKGVGRKLMAAVTCAAMLMSSVPLHVQAEEIVSAEEVQGEEDSILLEEESLPELSAPQGDEVSYEESSLIESNASVQEDSFSAEDAFESAVLEDAFSVEDAMEGSVPEEFAEAEGTPSEESAEVEDGIVSEEISTDEMQEDLYSENIEESADLEVSGEAVFFDEEEVDTDLEDGFDAVDETAEVDFSAFEEEFALTDEEAEKDPAEIEEELDELGETAREFELDEIEEETDLIEEADLENAAEEFTGYVLMNIPYSEFYAAELAEGCTAVDAVSSATKNKPRTGGLAGGSYHVDPAGSDISGVIYPVFVKDLGALEGLTQITDESSVDITVTNRGQTTTTTYSGKDALFESADYSYYMLNEKPARYKTMTVGEDGSRSFSAVSGRAATVDGATGEVTVGARHADIEIKLSLPSGVAQGEAISGVVVTTDDGKTYGLRHVANVWRGTEIGWNQAENDIAGKTITNIRYYKQDAVIDYPVEICVHTLQHTDAKDPVCEKDGNTEYWECTVCGKFFSDQQAKTQIDKAQTVVKATGHSYGSWTRADNDTHQKVCANDASHVLKEKHTWDKGTVTVEPAVGKAGIRTYKCTACGALRTEELPKLEITLPKVTGLRTVGAYSKKAFALTFNPAAGASDYEVSYRKIGEEWKSAGMTGGKTSFTLTGLDDASEYDIRVRAAVTVNDKNIYGPYSNISHRWVAKTFFTLTAKNNALKVSVTPVKDADGYLIKWADNADFTNASSQKLTGSKTAYTIKNLTAGKKYYFAVRPYKTENTATYSGIFSKRSRTAVAKPGKVSGVKASVNAAKKTMEIRFSKVKKASDYQIAYRIAGTKTWKLVRTKGKTAYTLKKLKAGKTYQVRVRAVGRSGSDKLYGSYSAIVKKTVKKTNKTA